MNQTLEHKLRSPENPNFKSEGERRIAKFLESNSIKYRYEPGLLISPEQEKPRIWYPDFYLPEFGAYIEYFGLVGHRNYDKGITMKETQYSKMGLAVIPVYPWTFSANWQGYIMEALEQITMRRYKDLMAKPYWSQDKSVPHYGHNSRRSGYHHVSSNRY